MRFPGSMINADSVSIQDSVWDHDTDSVRPRTVPVPHVSYWYGHKLSPIGANLQSEPQRINQNRMALLRRAIAPQEVLAVNPALVNTVRQWVPTMRTTVQAKTCSERDVCGAK